MYVGCGLGNPGNLSPCSNHHQQLLGSPPDIEDRRRYVCALSEMPHISASVHKLDQWRWLDQVKCHQQDPVGVPAATVADLPTVSGLGCRSEMEL